MCAISVGSAILPLIPPSVLTLWRLCWNTALGVGEERAGDELKEFLLGHFQASDGAVAMRQGKVFRIPTIVPKLTENGCVFLDEDDRCKIWEHAPVGCSHFDVHQTAEEANRISQWALRANMMAFEAEDHYARVWHWLWDIGKVPPPVAERREKLQQELKRIEASGGGQRKILLN